VGCISDSVTFLTKGFDQHQLLCDFRNAQMSYRKGDGGCGTSINSFVSFHTVNLWPSH